MILKICISEQSGLVVEEGYLVCGSALTPQQVASQAFDRMEGNADESEWCVTTDIKDALDMEIDEKKRYRDLMYGE